MGDAKQAGMDRAGELPMERRVSERRDAPAPPEVAVKSIAEQQKELKAMMARAAADHPETMEVAEKLAGLMSGNPEPKPLMYMFRVSNREQNHRVFKDVLDESDLPEQWTALYAHPSPAVPVAAGLPAIPEGWKLVPVEPTQEMYLAACRAFSAWSHTTTEQPDFTHSDSYRAMLAAAPALPVEQPSQPAVRTAGCTLCGFCAATGERITASPIAEPDTATQVPKDEQDAARYKFLRDLMCFCEGEDGKAVMVLRSHIPAPHHNFHTDWVGERFDPSVDAAIDAAIESHLKGE